MRDLAILLIHFLVTIAKLMCPGAYGPSWLTILGHSKDSLWSIDLFRWNPSF